MSFDKHISPYRTGEREPQQILRHLLQPAKRVHRALAALPTWQLEDVLFNEEMKIGRNFQVSFAKDVGNRVLLVHLTAAHAWLALFAGIFWGNFVKILIFLKNCLVDSNWNVKLTNFG